MKARIIYILFLLAGIALAAIRSDSVDGAFIHGYLSATCFAVSMFIALWFEL